MPQAWGYKCLGNYAVYSESQLGHEDLKTVSQPEAARILGFSENTVAKWVRAGILPAVREPGGRARIKMTDLRAFFRSWPDYRDDSDGEFAASSATDATQKIVA